MHGRVAAVRQLRVPAAAARAVPGRSVRARLQDRRPGWRGGSKSKDGPESTSVSRSADVTEYVTVDASGAAVQVDTSAMGTLVDTRKIEGLPLNGRDFFQLASLVPGRPTAGRRVAELDAGRRRQHQRRARAGEQLPARRRGQQRPVHQPDRRAAGARLRAGVQDPVGQLQRRVRAERRRPVQRGDEGRDEPVARLGVRVLPRRSARREELLRRPRPPHPGVQPAAVRGDRRRPAPARPPVRVRQLRAHPRRQGLHARGDRPAAGLAPGRLLEPADRPGESGDRPGLRPAVQPVHAHAVLRQHHPAGIHRPGRRRASSGSTPPPTTARRRRRRARSSRLSATTASTRRR